MSMIGLAFLLWFPGMLFFAFAETKSFEPIAVGFLSIVAIIGLIGVVLLGLTLSVVILFVIVEGILELFQ